MGTVGANKLSLVNADTQGTTIAFPDVCKTPSNGIPIPYPNVARSSDTAKATKKVKVEGKPVCNAASTFSRSTGDEAGSYGGVVSGCTSGQAEFVNYSFDVKLEGKGAPRSFDLMLHNKKNTPPFPLLQGPVVAMGKDPDGERCPVCGKKK